MKKLRITSFIILASISTSFDANSSLQIEEAWYSLRGVVHMNGRDCQSVELVLEQFLFTPFLATGDREVRVEVGQSNFASKGCKDDSVIFSIDFALSYDADADLDASMLEIAFRCRQNLFSVKTYSSGESGVFDIDLSEVQETCLQFEHY